MSNSDIFIDALRRLCDAHGGPPAIARRTGLSAENIKQILKGVPLPSGNPRGVGPGLRKALSEHYPSWLAQPQAGPVTTNPPAATLRIYENHDVKRPSAPPNKDDPSNLIAGIPGSLHLIRTATYTSPHVVEWEQLMSMIDRDGPGFLEAGVWVAIRDDAMAPGLSPGDLAYFVRGLAPKPGGQVLVRGRNSPPEVRGYRHITPGIFEAVPTNTAGYATLHSERDELEVLAVLVRYTKEAAY